MIDACRAPLKALRVDRTGDRCGHPPQRPIRRPKSHQLPAPCCTPAVIGGPCQQPHLAREALRRREVDRLAQRDPQRRRHAAPAAPSSRPGARRGLRREDLDVLRARAPCRPGPGPLVARDEHVHPRARAARAPATPPRRRRRPVRRGARARRSPACARRRPSPRGSRCPPGWPRRRAGPPRPGRCAAQPRGAYRPGPTGGARSVGRSGSPAAIAPRLTSTGDRLADPRRRAPVRGRPCRSPPVLRARGPGHRAAAAPPPAARSPRSAVMRTARTPGSSSAMRAPRSVGAVASRPPWLRAIWSAIARPAAAPRPVRRAAGASAPRPARAARAHDRPPRRARAPPRRADRELHRPAAVLERVGHEVRQRLGQPDTVAAHQHPRASVGADPQIAAERAGDGVPARELLLDELGRRRRARRAARRRAPPGRGEVVERQCRRAAARRRAPRARAGRRLLTALHRRRASSRAAVSGPRSSWQARATSSRRWRQAQRLDASPRRAPASAPHHPSSPSAVIASPARRRAGSRRPTR